MVWTQVCVLLALNCVVTAAFDPRQLIGQTYQGLKTGQRTGGLSLGLSSAAHHDQGLKTGQRTGGLSLGLSSAVHHDHGSKTGQKTGALTLGLSAVHHAHGQGAGQRSGLAQPLSSAGAGSQLSPLSPSFLTVLDTYRKGGKSTHQPAGSLFPAASRPQTPGSVSTDLSSLFQKVDPSIPKPNTPMHGVVCDEPALACVEDKYRTADGSCNNLHGHSSWGMAGRPQERLLPPMYANGRDMPRSRGIRGQMLPSAREVSQVLHTGDNPYTESANLTHLFTMWGQFLDHDVTHTPVARDMDGSKLDCCNQPLMYPERDMYWIAPIDLSSTQHHTSTSNPNCFAIRLSPATDRFFNSTCMNFVRSKPFAPSPTCRSRQREQGNTQTSFIDASQVYGPLLGDQFALRTGHKGLLKSGGHDLLPENSTTMCTRHEGEFCFGSGDPRVNEHPMLSSIHVVFHRLHNVLALHLALINPHWSDEILYQEARKIVGAIMQHVTYAEYLPLVVGDEEMRRYNLTLHGSGPYEYDPYVNPNIINSFSAAAFRFGHSMVNGKNSYGFQKLNLRDMFFHPHFVQHDHGAGLNMVLNGLIRDRSQGGDLHMNGDLTDHLFRNKDGRSLDLAALNVQRGRDHGLAPFDEFRKFCGLPTLREATRIGKFADVPFLRVYRTLQDVDLFTGGLAERPMRGGVVGPTFSCILSRQFHNLKFGDRFWYQNTRHAGAFTPAQIQTIEGLGLADVMCATTTMSAVQVNPFVEASLGNPVRDCSSFRPIDLGAWQER